jgi:hypothetical protein
MFREEEQQTVSAFSWKTPSARCLEARGKKRTRFGVQGIGLVCGAGWLDEPGSGSVSLLTIWNANRDDSTSCGGAEKKTATCMIKRQRQGEDASTLTKGRAEMPATPGEWPCPRSVLRVLAPEAASRRQTLRSPDKRGRGRTATAGTQRVVAPAAALRLGAHAARSPPQRTGPSALKPLWQAFRTFNLA